LPEKSRFLTGIGGLIRLGAVCYLAPYSRIGIKSTLDPCFVILKKRIMPRPLRIEYPDAWYHVMNRVRRGESVFRKKGYYKRAKQCGDSSVEVSTRGQLGGDWPGIQYQPIQFGQQCRRKNEGENIRGSTIEKTCRGNQNCHLHESSVDLSPLRAHWL
jgi:hypothetical protein